MLKKSFIFILCMALLPCILSASATKDIAQTTHILAALGFITDDTEYNTDESISRGEFATMLLPLTKNIGEYNKNYNDVPKSHFAYNAVSAISALKIMDGASEDRFGVDESITFEQLAKVSVCLTGYELYAKEAGGYPYGYKKVANDNGVFKNVNLQNKIPTKGDVALVLLNTLNVDVLEIVSQGRLIKVERKKGVTLLSDRLKVKHSYGVVNANSDTALFNPDSDILTEEVLIDTQTFKTGKTNAKDLLGYSVEYYAKEIESETWELLYIAVEQKKNEVLTVKSENIESAELGQLIYNDSDGRIKKANISKNADLIYNGKAKAFINPVDIFPDYGKVTLVDRDMDGVFDSIFTESFITVVVEAVSVQENMIRGKYNQGIITLPNSSKSERYEIIQNGEEVGIETLKEWDVLTVKADVEEVVNGVKRISSEASLIHMELTQNSFMGEVSETEDDEIRIGSKTYKISNSFIQAVQNGTAENIAVGKKGRFYLDASGRIASYRVDGKTLKYGYALNTALKSGIETDVRVKLINEFSEIEELKISGKIKLDGKSNTKVEEFLSRISKDGKLVPQIIGYKIRETGEINEIDTLYLDTYYEDSKTSLSVGAKRETYKQYYRGTERSLGGKIIVDSNATVFVAPLVELDADDSNYSVKGAGYFTNNNYYYVEGYNFSGAETCSLMVVYNDVKIEDMTGIAVVDKVTRTFNREGGEVAKLYLYTEKEYFGIETADNAVGFNNLTGNAAYTFKDISKGDVIRYSNDRYMRITSIEARYDANFNRPLHQIGVFKDTFRTVLGKVNSVSGNIVQISYSEDFSDLTTAQLFNLTNTKILVYYSKENRLEQGGIANIISYEMTQNAENASKMYLHTRNGSTMLAVIYK